MRSLYDTCSHVTASWADICLLAVNGTWRWCAELRNLYSVRLAGAAAALQLGECELRQCRLLSGPFVTMSVVREVQLIDNYSRNVKQSSRQCFDQGPTGPGS